MRPFILEFDFEFCFQPIDSPDNNPDTTHHGSLMPRIWKGYVQLLFASRAMLRMMWDVIKYDLDVILFNCKFLLLSVRYIYIYIFVFVCLCQCVGFG